MLSEASKFEEEQVRQRAYPVLLSSVLCLLSICLFAPLAFSAPKSELLPGWSQHNPASTISIDHQPLDQFLTKYRSMGSDGIVLIAYGSVTKEDHTALKTYLESLQEVDVKSLNKPEQFAYWVNLYNTATVDLILQYRPEKSIKDIDISPGFFSSGPWGKTFLKVAGKDLSLDNIEHGILRPLWKDPRTHYVLNCASIGCPDIPPNALQAHGLENSLNKAAQTYINHSRAVRFDSDDSVTLSSIYNWFDDDFGGNKESILDHLKIYANAKNLILLKKVKTISGYRYDWSLNGSSDGS